MKYAATLKIEGNFVVLVEAETLDKAKQQASELGCEIDCGELSNIEWDVSKIKNLDTDKTYYL